MKTCDGKTCLKLTNIIAAKVCSEEMALADARVYEESNMAALLCEGAGHVVQISAFH